MNALLESFPIAVEVGGKVYPVNADYRIGLRIMLAFGDQDLMGWEKQLVMLRLLYQEIPDDVAGAISQAVKFLNCGEDISQKSDADGPRLYSWGQDAKYIYSAIKQSHGVDLESTDFLHWWKFCIFFMDLREDCFFSRLIYLRKQKAAGKLTKEEQTLCRSIQDIVDLPEQRSSAEQAIADKFMTQLNGY